MFFKMGCLFALSILNSSPGPSFLAPCVVQYLFHGMESLEVTPPNIEEVPDSIIKGGRNQVRLCIKQSCDFFLKFDWQYCVACLSMLMLCYDMINNINVVLWT